MTTEEQQILSIRTKFCAQQYKMADLIERGLYTKPSFNINYILIQDMDNPDIPLNLRNKIIAYLLWNE